MAKQVITSDKLYPVYGPYSHAVRVGDMIFLHGTVRSEERRVGKECRL